MYLRTLRPPALPGPPVKRRRTFPWARVLLICAIIGAIAFVAIPRYFALGADGVVQGDLVPVAPLFNARLTNRLVECEQNVSRGQPIAIVTNFIMEGQYQQEYQKTMQDERTEQIAATEGVGQAITEEADARAKYDSALYDARRLEVTKDAYERTYRDGAIGRVAYENAKAEWQAAVAEADGYRSMLTAAQQHARRVEDQSAQSVAGYQQEAQVVTSLRDQVHSQTLRAPISGRVVECVAQPAQVVNAGAPIYKIFAPNRAYVLAFFDPNNVSRVHLGAKAVVTVPGIDTPMDGHVTAIYSNLSKLPDQLTRYFWQKEQWAEYRPVKVVLTGVSPAMLQELTYDSQVRVSIKEPGSPWKNLKRSVGMR